jgi:hypothetical protein
MAEDTDHPTIERTIELLLRAVDRIHRRMAAAPPGPWQSLANGDRLIAPTDIPGRDFVHVITEPVDAGVSEFIAMMDPTVAAEIADYLKATANDIRQGVKRTSYSAVRIAHAVLRENTHG